VTPDTGYDDRENQNAKHEVRDHVATHKARKSGKLLVTERTIVAPPQKALHRQAIDDAVV
jgi:hypothetical protein